MCGSDDWSEADGAELITDKIYNIAMVDRDDGLLVLGTANKQIEIFLVTRNQTSKVGDETSVAGDRLVGLRAANIDIDGESRIAVVVLEEHGGMRFSLFDPQGNLIDGFDMVELLSNGDIDGQPVTRSESLKLHSVSSDSSELPYLTVLWQEVDATLKSCVLTFSANGLETHSCGGTIATGISPYSGALTSFSATDALITWTSGESYEAGAQLCQSDGCNGTPGFAPPSVGYANLLNDASGAYWWTGISPSESGGILARQGALGLTITPFDEQLDLGSFVVESALQPDIETTLGWVYLLIRSSGVRDLYFRCASFQNNQVRLFEPARITQAARHDTTTPRVMWSSYFGGFVTIFTDQRSGSESDGIYYSVLSSCQ